MSPEEQMTFLREHALPKLFEGGVECFVLVGFVRTPDDKLQRICLAHSGDNPAYEDALRPVIHFAHVWGSNVRPDSPYAPNE